MGWYPGKFLGRQVVPATGERVDGQVDAIIKQKQDEWTARGWSQGLVKAATDQMVDYAEGIASFAGRGNPELEKEIIRNLFVSGEAPRMADNFGTRFLAAMTSPSPP